MANSMNKSAAVITGTGANSIIRAAKMMLPSHYSHRPLHVKICVQTGAPLHIIYSESRGLKKGGKRVIMLKIASKEVEGRPCPGTTVEVRHPLVGRAPMSLPGVVHYSDRGHPPGSEHVSQRNHLFRDYLISQPRMDDDVL